MSAQDGRQGASEISDLLQLSIRVQTILNAGQGRIIGQGNHEKGNLNTKVLEYKAVYHTCW
jgi:hypothetical protein